MSFFFGVTINNTIAGAAGTAAQDFILLFVCFGVIKSMGQVAKLTGFLENADLGKWGKKKTKEAFGENMHGLKTGNRFSGNRFIPGSARLAKVANRAGFGLTTGNVLPTGKARAAFGQTSLAAAKELMKGEAYGSIAENDDAKRYATYFHDRQGFRAVRDNAYKDLLLNGKNANGTRMTEAQARKAATQRAKEARDAFNASGLEKGGATAIAGALGLGRGGTGYANLEDEVNTIARASKGGVQRGAITNDTIAREVAGDLNANSKEKRGFDLTPGNNELASMSLAVAHNGVGAVSKGTFHQMTAQSARNSGTVSQMLGTAKGQGINGWAEAEKQNRKAMKARANVAARGKNWQNDEAFLRGYYGGRHNDADVIQQEKDAAVEFSATAAEAMATNYSFGSAQNARTMEEAELQRNAAVNRDKLLASNATRTFSGNRPDLVS